MLQSFPRIRSCCVNILIFIELKRVCLERGNIWRLRIWVQTTLETGEPLLTILGVEPDEECNAAKGDAAESDNHRNHVIYFLVILMLP